MAKIHSGNPLATVPCVTELTFIRPPKVWRRRLQPPDSVHLRRALRLEPRNQWALRNPGGCLLQLGRAAEALPVLQTALEIGPQDPQTLLGMGQSLEAHNRSDDADDYYQRIIRLGTPEPVVELAKERRSAIAAQRMRSAGESRPDVLMYLTGAFSGLHLCCLMYAAFKKFAPARDVGIDFSREWMQLNGGG